MHAARGGHAAAVTALLDKGASRDLADKVDKVCAVDSTASLIQCIGGYIMQRLLSLGVSVYACL